MLQLFFMLSVFSATYGSNIHSREVYETEFINFMKKFQLSYEEKSEYARRLQIFSDNFDVIEKHNSDQSSTYKMGINQFSAMTLEEFQKATSSGGYKKSNLRKSANKIHPIPSDISALPDSVDWSTTGAVSSVKNQGSCGSCWSFSATGGMEGAYFTKYGTSVSFSEQNLVSCDKVDSGCNGGLMDNAFTFAQQNGGLCSEADYPYVSGNGNVPACSTSCSNVANSKPSGYTDVTTKSVDALMSAVAQQPVSIAIQANQVAFQTYSSGVLTGKCGQNLDHGVLAVGYGTWTDGTPYWKVKNSWGSSWGMDGYILIERSSDDLCGVLDDPSYPYY